MEPGVTLTEHMRNFENPIFELLSVKRYFKSGKELVPAIDDINLAIYPGDFTTITGASGSGKTTLLNLIGLLDSPTDGKVVLHSKDTADMSPRQKSAARLKNIGFIFQFFNLQKNLTALENVMIPRWLAGHSRTDSEERSRQLLDRMGLASRQDHLPSELSGGQQQRVAIARALVNSPTVILADEPTGNLDSRTTNDIIELFEELNHEGQTIIMVTHEKELTQRTKRTITLKDGKILHELSGIDISNERVQSSIRSRS